MKKLFVSLTVCLVGYCAHAQDSTRFSLNLNFTVAPQAMFEIGVSKFPKMISTPLFADVTFSAKKSAVTTFYNFSNNSVGVLYGYSPNRAVTLYAVGTKSLSEKGGYTGIGICHGVLKNVAVFMEFGTLYGAETFHSFFFTGAFVSFGEDVWRK